MNTIDSRPRNDDLYRAILTLRTVEECKKFFEDLCSVAELTAMEHRFGVAERLENGMIYNDILEETGASSATISRVNRTLRYGSGGFRIAFNRMKKEEEEG